MEKSSKSLPDAFATMVKEMGSYVTAFCDRMTKEHLEAKGFSLEFGKEVPPEVLERFSVASENTPEPGIAAEYWVEDKTEPGKTWPRVRVCLNEMGIDVHYVEKEPG